MYLNQYFTILFELMKADEGTTPPACVCFLVTLLDTRTVPGELKWAASPSEGGVSGSIFLFHLQ